MNYNLPENLKTYTFFCEEVNDFVRLSRCKRLCPATYRKCWESKLRQDLELDCDVENEKQAEEYICCFSCGSENMVGMAFNRFMCLDCGSSATVDKAEYKELMGEDYLEIDETRLTEMFKQIR